MTAVAVEQQYRVKIGTGKPHVAESAESALQCAVAALSVENTEVPCDVWIGLRESPYNLVDALARLESDGAVLLYQFFDDMKGESALVEMFAPAAISQNGPQSIVPNVAMTAGAAALLGENLYIPDATAIPVTPAPQIATEMPEDEGYTPFSPGSQAPSVAQGNSYEERAELARQLRENTCGVRITRKQFWVKRSLSQSQVEEASQPFGADPALIKATRMILDTQHPAYAKVLRIMRDARKYWLATSVDYPIASIRLIRKTHVPVFNERMHAFQQELAVALGELENAYPEMRDAAQTRLGELYNPEDYPDALRINFQLGWDFPNVEPPNHLKELHPEIYEQQQKLVAARFEEAIRVHEEAFASELQGLVGHLIEKLTATGEDGQLKRLNKKAVENVREFFQKFKDSSISSSRELDELMMHAEKTLEGVDPNDLRQDHAKRQAVAQDMQQVKALLDSMLVARPGRAIDLDALGEAD